MAPLQHNTTTIEAKNKFQRLSFHFTITGLIISLLDLYSYINCKSKFGIFAKQAQVKSHNFISLNIIMATDTQHIIPAPVIPQVNVPPHHQWPQLSKSEIYLLKERIKTLLVEQNAVLVAHYYTDGSLQDLAEETGGCVADSLEMARFGTEHPAQTLVVAGVRFMGETSKILNTEKRILMPDLGATCSLDEGCPYEMFASFCDQHPDHTVVVYANTSAQVKARSDWVVTSGIALPIIQHLSDNGEKILWAPDKHLGGYVQKLTGAEDDILARILRCTRRIPLSCPDKAQ